MARKRRSDRPKRSTKRKAAKPGGRPNKRHPNRRQNRKQSQVETPRLKGTLQLSGDGSGQLIPEKKDKDYVFLHPEEVLGLQTGDVVTAELHVGRRGKVKGRIVEVHQQITETSVVGIVQENHRGLFVVPHGGGIPIVVEDTSKLELNKAVVVKITERGDDRNLRGANWRKCSVMQTMKWWPFRPRFWPPDFPMIFPKKFLRKRPQHPTSIANAVLDGLRKDLRKVTHVTIDGADARDFDDAVAAVQESGGIRVWVSIADVATYVTPGSALDDEAQNRATSVYFPHTVLPMLPEHLSNGLCSLRPNELRLAMTCEFLVNSSGKPQDINIYPSLIESAARLTYEQAQSVLDNTEAAQELPEPIRLLIQRLSIVSQQIRKERQGRGCLELDLPEAQVLVDEENRPVGIVRQTESMPTS